MESVGRQLAVVMRPAVGDSNGDLLHSFLRVRIHISYCSDSTVIPLVRIHFTNVVYLSQVSLCLT